MDLKNTSIHFKRNEFNLLVLNGLGTIDEKFINLLQTDESKHLRLLCVF